VRLSRILAVTVFVFIVLAIVSYLTAVWSRQLNTLYGDAPLDLGAVYGFLALAIVSVAAFGVALTWERSRMSSTAPAHFVGEDDRDPGEVRTRIRDGEVRRISGDKY
jgi:hypothetical protein